MALPPIFIFAGITFLMTGIAIGKLVYDAVKVVQANRQARRRNKGQCRHCGYSLRYNTSGVCPECGAKIRQSY